MNANKTPWRRGCLILSIIVIVSSTPFLATAGGLAKILEAVGLTGAHDAGCAGRWAGEPAKSNVACGASPKPGAQHFPKPGRERPLQFNFRRY